MLHAIWRPLSDVCLCFLSFTDRTVAKSSMIYFIVSLLFALVFLGVRLPYMAWTTYLFLFRVDLSQPGMLFENAL
jgi:hypothetical protein